MTSLMKKRNYSGGLVKEIKILSGRVYIDAFEVREDIYEGSQRIMRTLETFQATVNSLKKTLTAYEDWVKKTLEEQKLEGEE